jgi:hypothetical protein
VRLVAVVAFAALLALAAPASLTQPHAAAHEEPADLARRMAEPWPSIQQSRGNLPDYLDGFVGFPVRKYRGTRYGDAVMGYSLIAVGVRENERRFTAAGLRAIAYAIGPYSRHHRPSVFEQLGVAGAYRLARDHLAGDPLFQRIRRRWEGWIRRQRPYRLQRWAPLGNHVLVEVCAALAILETGLHSSDRHSVLGRGRAWAMRRVRHIVNRRAPRQARGSGPYVLSDAPDYPPAYLALTSALYARVVDSLGRDAAPGARRLLRRAADASVLVAAPDGDIAYWGRSQEQVWAPPAAAYAASVAAELPGTPDATASRYRALAASALERLSRAYPVGSRGQYVVPGLRRSLRGSHRMLDEYAGAPSMGGLALMMLNWTIDDTREGAPAPAPAGGDHAVVLGSGDGRVAIVRSGSLWWVVRMRPTRHRLYAGDLRYDSGLVALKRQFQDGWRDVMPIRPRTKRRFGDTAGPVLLAPGGRRPFEGRSIRAAGGAVTVRGGLGRRRAGVRYKPSGCGVEMAFRGRRGDRFELSAFFARRPSVEPRAVVAGGRRAELNLPARVRLESGYASATEPRLVRARITVRLPRSQSVRMLVC